MATVLFKQFGICEIRLFICKDSSFWLCYGVVDPEVREEYMAPSRGEEMAEGLQASSSSSPWISEVEADWKQQVAVAGKLWWAGFMDACCLHRALASCKRSVLPVPFFSVVVQATFHPHLIGISFSSCNTEDMMFQWTFRREMWSMTFGMCLQSAWSIQFPILNFWIDYYHWIGDIEYGNVSAWIECVSWILLKVDWGADSCEGF